MDSGSLEVGFGDFFPDELVADSTEFAAVDAFEAAHTFRAVWALVYFDVHRAIFPAFVAKGAFLIVHDHSEKADFVE